MAFTPFKKVKTKSNEQLIQDIDERLKVNKGGFSAEGFNADSTFTPSRVSDRAVANPMGTMNAFQRVEQPELQGADYSNVQTNTELPAPQEENIEDYGITASDMNNAIFEVSNPFTELSDDQKYEIFREQGIPYFIQNTEDGGLLFSDNVIRYPDGTVQINDSGMPRQQGTADDFITQETFGFVGKGVDSMMQYLFGDQAQITQSYGNKNPGLYKLGYHGGTDVVANGSFSLPVAAKVVQVFEDDGTRWGDTTGHQGYGNSILVEFPTGERFRYSHLAAKPQFNVGETIPAYTPFGTMGSTGNSTGNHVDFEYYNSQGRRDNPANWSGFKGDTSWKQQVLENVKNVFNLNKQTPAKEETGQVLGQQTEQSQPQQQNNQVQQQIKPEYQNTQIQKNRSLPAQVRGAARQVGQVLGAANEQARESQANMIAGMGTALKLPELKTNELSNEQKTNPYAQAVGNVTDVIGNKLGMKERGISEFLAGGNTTTTGEVNTNENIAERIKQGAGNAITFVNDFLSNIKAPELPKPGEFLNKPAYASELKSPQFSQMNKEYGMQIGDSPTSSMVSQPSMRMGETYQSRQAESSSDIRDPFFKPGGASQQYSQYLKPNADQVAGGALDTSVFGNDFFERRTAQPDIQSVFGGTHMEGQANQKFEGYRTAENDKAINQIKSMYGGGEWDQADVSRIIAEIRQGKGFIDPSQVRQPSKAYKPTIEDYLRQGKTIAQYYAETGQQGVLDKFGSPEAAMKAYNEAKGAANRGFSGQNVDISNVNLTPQQYQQSYQQVTQGNKPSDPNGLYRADQQYQQSTQNFGNVYNGMKVNLGESASPFDLFKKKNLPNVNGYLKL